DPVNHDVTVLVPGNMVLSITTGANPQAPVILLGAITQPSPVVITVPWGGSLDLGVAGGPAGLTGVELIVDGNNPTSIPDFFAASDDGLPGLGILPEYLLVYSGGSNLAGVAFAFQGIILDPSATAGLDSTEVVDANFVLGTAIVAGTGDDGSFEVPFSFGNTFEFHGVSHTSAWVVGNGFMTFGAMTTMAFGGFNRDNVLWLNDQPSIAPSYGDWAPGGIGMPSGPNNNTGVLVEQVGNIANIVWGDPQVGEVSHFMDGDLNTFGATLTLNDGVDTNQGFFSIQWPLIDPAVTNEFGNGLIGHTPGAVIAGGAADQDLNNIDGSGAVGAANEAQFEEHDFAANAFSTIGGDGLGLRRSYNNFTINKAGRSIDFIPLTTTLAGDGGYLALGDHLVNAQPDDATEFVASNSFTTTGGEFRAIGGVFLNFDAGLGSVTFDPAGTQSGPFLAVVNGVYDDTGSSGFSIPNPDTLTFRSGQGLEIVTNPMPGLSGAVDVLVDFGNGSTFTIQANINAPGSVFTSYTLGDDDSVNHVLQTGNTITWYGVTYTDLNISSNGPVTFGGSTTDFGNSVPSMLSGFGGAALPGASAVWADLDGDSGGTYEVLENTILLNTTVIFNNCVEFVGAGSLGVWSAQFEALGPNTCIMDYTGMAGAANVIGGGSTTGVTNGDDTMGSQTDLSDTLGTGIDAAILAAAGTYSSSGSAAILPDNIGEDVPGGFDYSSIAGGLGTRTWIDAAGIGDWILF
ncbi:MAG: hypothetical protein V3W41_03450, partial [Planctomycetota bacterium]